MISNIRQNVTKDKEGDYLTRIHELKIKNIQKIRACFYDKEIWTKNELAKRTDLSLAGTTNILQMLLHNQEIQYIGEAQSTGGRKSKQYILNKDHHHIGMIICYRNNQHYYFFSKIVDLMNHILNEKKWITPKGEVDDLMAVLDDVITRDPLVSLCVLSIPGVCQNGQIDLCDFENFVHYDLVKEIKKRYAIQVIIENDVNLACLGLSHVYPDIQDLAFIYQPQVKYVGCGIVIQQKLYKGFSCFAGELRYLPFYSHDKQDQLLKDHPYELLQSQIAVLCCVFNPQLIGVCSDVLHNIDEAILDNGIPQAYLPKLICINDLHHIIYDGLYHMGIQELKEKENEDE